MFGRILALEFIVRTGLPPSTTRSPRSLRRRLDDASPVARTILLCGATALVVGAASADWEVERGDTLYSIARSTDTTVDRLVAANDIADPDLIVVGQELEIPGGGSTGGATTGSGDDGATSAPTVSASSDDARTTVVRPGDGVSSLADRLGVDREQFMAANGFTSSSQVLAGARVRSHAGPTPGRGTADATVVVQSGDTLAGIADDVGRSWQTLAEANDLSDPGMIVAGQRLTVPGRSGGFACPVSGGHFVNDFGIAKAGGRFHEGIDVFAPHGTTVRAPVGGTVEHLTGTRGGRQAHLFGDDGYRYWATHLDTLAAGGRVEAGDALGTVGTSGNAAGGPPHVHFEAYWSGQSVNPYPALREAC